MENYKNEESIKEKARMEDLYAKVKKMLEELKRRICEVNIK